MNALLEIAISNVLMAGALAVPAALAALWGRKPALTHGLWLLVLLKLVTPPLFQVPVSWPELRAASSAPRADVPEPRPELPEPLAALPEAFPEERAQPIFDNLPFNPTPSVDLPVEPPLPAPDIRPPEAAPDFTIAAPAEDVAIRWTTWLSGLGLTGTAVWLVFAARRLRRFQRLLRFACPAADAVQHEARALAATMGVRCPQVLLMPATISPMLWVGGAPRLLLPEALVARLRPRQLATVMAHELAHWRRGDHRVRWLEMLVLSLYWWCPLAWWARSQLQQAEEECCDAWVVAVLPDAAREYALALVDTIDFLSGASAPLPPVASGVGHVRHLKRRLTMIMGGTTPQSLTRVGLLSVAGLGLFLLPFVPGRAQQPAEKITLDKAIEFTQAPSPFGAEPPPSPEAAVKARQIQLDMLKRRQALEAQRRQVEEQIHQLEAAMKKLHAELGNLPQPLVVPAPPNAGHPVAKAKGQTASDAFNVFGRQPGQPANVFGPPGHPAGIEQRLEQVERKLDVLLWEIANMRRDMTKGRSPMGPPGGMMPPGMGGPGGGGGAPGKAFPGGGAPGFPSKPGSSGTPAAPSGAATPPFDNNPQAPPGAATPPKPATPASSPAGAAPVQPPIGDLQFAPLPKNP